MYQETYKSQPSIVGLFGIAAVIVLVIGYGATALNTGDMLWFWPRNDNQPNSIVVHCYSEDIVVAPSSPHYAQITALVNDAMSGQKRWDPLSLSDVTYQEYISHPNMMTLEVSYPKPVRIHTNTAFFSNVDMLIFPLDARHSSKQVVFGRTQAGHPAAGSLFIDSTEGVKDYLSDNSICLSANNGMWDASDAQIEGAKPSQN